MGRHIWRYLIQNELSFEFMACGDRTPLIRSEPLTELPPILFSIHQDSMNSSSKDTPP